MGFRRLFKEGLDIVGSLRNRRGLRGKETRGVNLRRRDEVGFEEEKITKREKAVKITSGKEVGLGCGGGVCGGG